MKESFDEIFNTNPKIATSIAFLLGLILTNDLSAYEQSSLGNWLMLISQTIITNASLQNLIETKIQTNTININSREVKCLYNPIIYDLNKTKNIINLIYKKNSYKNIDELEILQRAIDNLQIQIKKIKDKD